MISIIEALFGSKVGRVLAEILFGLILAAALVLHFEHEGAKQALAKMQASSAELVQTVTRQNAQTTAQYEAAVAANQEKTHEAQASVATLQSRLADSVRQYDAYRSAHPDVAGAAGAGGAAQPGECGPEDCGALVERLAVRGNELAGSVGDLSADLQSCQRDRDALTGQPRLTTAPE